MITYAFETYEQIIGDLKPLLIDHWEELTAYPDIALDPDYPRYEMMQATGKMAVYSVRDDSALIGYAVYFGNTHAHYRTSLWALSDLFWIHPDHRNEGTGRGLFEFIEEDLRGKGVVAMHTTVKCAHPMAKFLLISLGHAMIEWGFSKRLN